MIDCSEWKTEKRHECANVGKEKRLELWWQLYRTSLPERDVRNITPMDFCSTECTGLAAHRGSRDIALLFLDHDTKRAWGVSVTPPPLFIPGNDPVPIVQEGGWAPGPVWTGAENLAPPPPDFDRRTVQPVASRYTDWATRPTKVSCRGWNDTSCCNYTSQWLSSFQIVRHWRRRVPRKP